MSVIFVSHKLDEVVRVVEHVAVLRNGRKVYDERRRPSRAELVRHMVGRDLQENKTRTSRQHGAVLLEAKD